MAAVGTVAAAGGGSAASDVGEEEIASVAEAPPARQRPTALRSEEYIRRIPAPKFQEWRMIETLTLALKEKPTIRPYVVCAGIPYGNGEEPFFGLFRAAYMTRPTLRVIGKGDNSLPLVHVRDTARLVRHVLEEQPDLDYHLAVDRGDTTQRELIEAVAKEFGVEYDIRSVSIPEALLAEFADMLTLDLRLEPSPLMQRPEPVPETSPDNEDGNADEGNANAAAAVAPTTTATAGGGVAGAGSAVPSGAAVPPAASPQAATPEQDAGDSINAGEGSLALQEKKKGFRWWCESGLVPNIGKIASEFRLWRRLGCIRICIPGPTGAPTAELGEILASRYNVLHISLDSVIEELRTAESDAGNALRAKLTEIEAALANPKSQGPFLLPAAMVAKAVEEAVASKPCLYRGYVISGFPQCVEEAVEFFTEQVPAGDDYVEESAVARKDKKGKADDGPKMIQVARETFRPDCVAFVFANDECCQTRLKAKGIPEEQWQPNFLRKMDRWNKETAEATPLLQDFFRSKLNLEPQVVTEPLPSSAAVPGESAASSSPAGAGAGAEALPQSQSPPAAVPSVEEVIEQAACDLSSKLEAMKEVNNFMPPPPKPKPQIDVAGEEGETEEDEAARRKEAEELRKRKEQEERLEQIKKEELVKLEKHSEPLRQYLMTFVVPQVTSGLIEVCRSQPEDPVGFLAEYLTVYSQLSRKRAKAARLAAAAAATASDPTATAVTVQAAAPA